LEHLDARTDEIHNE